MHPGQEVPVFSRTPAVISMSGSNGRVPQGTRGLLLTVLLLLTVVVGR